VSDPLLAQAAARAGRDASSDVPRASAARSAHTGMLPGCQHPLRGATDTMKDLICSFVKDEQGEDLIEYGLLAAFAAAILVILITDGGVRTALQNVMSKVVADLAI
jgi:Flp pilus assembly pilin Flp